MLLNDEAIEALCLHPGGDPRSDAMIEPFSVGVTSGGVVSYGLSHAGYDLRLGPELWLFKNSYNELIDPKRFKEDEEYKRRVFDLIRPDARGVYVMPPHSYALVSSVEYLRIPVTLKGRCVGKSTYARCAVLVNTTPLEPGWEGNLTIEVSNICPCPVVLYAAEGIAQLEFELLVAPPRKNYAGKKYQGQRGVTPARIN